MLKMNDSARFRGNFEEFLKNFDEKDEKRQGIGLENQKNSEKLRNKEKIRQKVRIYLKKIKPVLFFGFMIDRYCYYFEFEKQTDEHCISELFFKKRLLELNRDDAYDVICEVDFDFNSFVKCF